MSEQSNAELIAEARDATLTNDYERAYHGGLVGRLAAALEAAERRADQAEATAEHLHDEDTREIVALTQERDAAREEVGYEKRMREFISGERDRFIDLKRAAEQRAEKAEGDRDLFKREQVRLAARCDQAQNERNEYAAVVEKVRAADSASSSWEHFGHLVMDILATAPADALREYDATLIEGLADEWEALVQREKPPKRGSLWLRDKARQRRGHVYSEDDGQGDHCKACGIEREAGE